MSFAVGHQNWRQLVFVHWPVPAAHLRPLVPAPLSIDEFGGSAFVGLVAFVVEAARPLGARWSTLGLRFLETNVRTYVHVNGRDHGVYFFSLDATSLLAVVGARLSLGLPYFWAGGQADMTAHEMEYTLRRRVGGRPGCTLRYTVGDALGPSRPESLEHFLIERYLLHARRAASLWSVRVRHRPYPLHEVRLIGLEDQLVRSASILTADTRPLVHFASGVDVAIMPPRIRSVAAS